MHAGEGTCTVFAVWFFVASNKRRVFSPQIVHRDLTLGEVLDGDRMAVSLYEANFTMPVPHKELCTKILSKEDISKLQEAIEDLYYFEFVFGRRVGSGTNFKGTW